MSSPMKQRSVPINNFMENVPAFFVLFSSVINHAADTSVFDPAIPWSILLFLCLETKPRRGASSLLAFPLWLQISLVAIASWKTGEKPHRFEFDALNFVRFQGGGRVSRKANRYSPRPHIYSSPDLPGQRKFGWTWMHGKVPKCEHLKLSIEANRIRTTLIVSCPGHKAGASNHPHRTRARWPLPPWPKAILNQLLLLPHVCFG